MQVSTVLSKFEMSEEDIKLQYITPAIIAKWNIGRITMETQVTDGKINLRGNFVSREKPKRADYILYLNVNNPIAIIEAKDNKHSVSYGLQQAKAYAQMLDIPFAYSSNGDGFAEFDALTGKEREFSMDEFPTEAELVARYKQESGMTPVQETLVDQPYYSSQNTYPPRYYQRIAINRTVDAIARGQDRLLLVMATGTGKTYTAFQIVYRLLRSGLKRKILTLLTAIFLWISLSSRTLRRWKRSFIRSILPRIIRIPSLLMRYISPYISSWLVTIIKSISENCLRRISLISLSWMSVIVVL